MSYNLTTDDLFYSLQMHSDQKMLPKILETWPLEERIKALSSTSDADKNITLLGLLFLENKYKGVKTDKLLIEVFFKDIPAETRVALLTQPIHIDRGSRKGQTTALHLLAERQEPGILENVLEPLTNEQRAQVLCAPDQYGNTVLHTLAIKNNTAMFAEALAPFSKEKRVELLNKTNSSGKTANQYILEIAKLEGGEMQAKIQELTGVDLSSDDDKPMTNLVIAEDKDTMISGAENVTAAHVGAAGINPETIKEEHNLNRGNDDIIRK